MGDLLKFLPRQTVGVCAGYRGGKVVAAVALVTLGKGGLSLSFPKRNPFSAGDAVTVHLDDRVGSEIYSIELRVYRASYKGTVVSSRGREAEVALADYELFYGNRIVDADRAPDYTPTPDARVAGTLPPSPLLQPILADEHEHFNKLGVLVTRAPVRPHTTVMAFLNSPDDDIFLITMKSTYKYHNLVRDADCVFAIDHRGGFSFERQVDWNYTIYEALAHRVDPGQATFAEVQAEFIAKNPWEAAFFSDPSIEMIHLVPRRIIHQDILCD